MEQQTHSLRDWLVITKPMIMFTVAVTTLGGIYLSRPDTPALFSALIVTAVVLTAAGSAVINNVIDRDIDARMKRTSRRAIASGRISHKHALIYGISLIAAGLTIIVLYTNTLCIVLAAIAFADYILLYTLLLKRRTPFAALLGGISGAMPPLAGATAATGRLTPEGMLLFTLMFVWQPAHFWYLALHLKEDYRRADIPVMPLCYGDTYTRYQALLYAACLLPVTLLPYGLGMAGHVYLFVAVIFTTFFFIMNILFATNRVKSPLRMFFLSIFHLLVIFGTLVANKAG